MQSTRHEQQVNEFLRANPDYRAFELRKNLNKMMKVLDEGPFEHLLGYRPDAYKIDTNKRHLCVVEIDGTSFIDDYKLNNILNLWWELDCRMCYLHVTTISMYTGAKSTLTDDDLMRLYCERYVRECNETRKLLGSDKQFYDPQIALACLGLAP